MNRQEIVQRIMAWAKKVKEHYAMVIMTEEDWNNILNSIEKNRPFYVSAGFNELYTYYMEIMIDEIDQDQKTKNGTKEKNCA